MKGNSISKWFKWLFPGFFGLLIYFTIRLLTDTAYGTFFWERYFGLNAMEITMSFFVGYLFYFILKKHEKRQQEKGNQDFSIKSLLKEFLILLVYTVIAINTTITVGAALTDDGLDWHDFAIINVIPTLYIMLYFAIVRGNQYLKGYVENKVKLEKIANENLQTELKFLRNQFHPHFLFNALNTIYFQMDENVEEAKSTVQKFSHLLRYQIYDHQQGMVKLKSEFDYLDNYIDIMSTRKGERLQLKKDFDPSLDQAGIYPFLLQPLVENAFKYVGAKGNDPFKITIFARREGDFLDFEVENSCFPQQQDFEPNEEDGIGLNNLKRRLELLYGNDAVADFSKENGHYTAHLKIRLHEED